MSGGSFNYLCFQDQPDAWELSRMADELEDRGMTDAAEETRALIPAPPEALRDLWHAVEWHVSCDCDQKQVDESYGRYRAIIEGRA